MRRVVRRGDLVARGVVVVVVMVRLRSSLRQRRWAAECRVRALRDGSTSTSERMWARSSRGRPRRRESCAFAVGSGWCRPGDLAVRLLFFWRCCQAGFNGEPLLHIYLNIHFFDVFASAFATLCFVFGAIIVASQFENCMERAKSGEDRNDAAGRKAKAHFLGCTWRSMRELRGPYFLSPYLDFRGNSEKNGASADLLEDHVAAPAPQACI